MAVAPRLRVLALIDSLGTGGAERSLVELAPSLRARGVDLELAILDERAEGVAHELGPDLPVRVLGAAGRVAQGRAFRAAVGEVNPDVVHTTLFIADIVGRLARPGAGVPLLCSLVNTTYDPERVRADPRLRSAKVRAVQAVDAVTGLVVDHFHAISHAVADDARRHLRIGADRITVVPRGRDAARLGEPSAERRALVRETLGVADRRVVLAVGRVDAQKGHRHLVDALPALLAVDPSTVLLVAGRRGSASAAVEARIDELGLADDVRLLGYRHDVPDLLVGADVFAFPSVYEGLGGALLEAMALGTPIVASDIPAVREVATPAGARLVPPGDPAALAAAITEVDADRAATAALADEARRRFTDGYTLEVAADGMADLYRAVAQRARGGRVKVGARRLLARSPANRVAAARSRQKLAVLAYHAVVAPSTFEQHLDLLAERCSVVGLDEVLAAQRGEPLPPHPVLITFDDGDPTVLDHAAPALAARDMPAVAFVVAGYIDTEEPPWWEVVPAAVAAGHRPAGVDLPDEPGPAVTALKRVPDAERRAVVAALATATPLRRRQLRPEDLLALEAAGIEVGGHSLTHPVLDRCDDATLEREVATSAEMLAGWLGHRPRSFAYPNGDHDARVRAAVERAGYELAFGFDHRLQDPTAIDPLRVSRVRIDAGDPVDRLRLVTTGLEPWLVRAAGRVR